MLHCSYCFSRWSSVRSSVVRWVTVSVANGRYGFPSSAILVYAQELMPGKLRLVVGSLFGLAFAIAGVDSAVLGEVADETGINFVF